MHFLCTLGDFRSHCIRSMCVKCYQSLSSISHVPSALNPCCVRSMHNRYYQSLLHTLSMHLVLSILSCVLGAFDLFYMHLFLFPSLSIFSTSTYSSLLLFRSFHAWSSFKSWSFEPSPFHLILSMPSPAFPFPMPRTLLD